MVLRGYGPLFFSRIKSSGVGVGLALSVQVPGMVRKLPYMRLGVCFSLACAVSFVVLSLNRGQSARDFTWLYAAAVQLRSGVNPYHDLGTIIPAAWENARSTPLFYPLPAVLVALPFSFLPVEVAGVVFSSVSAFLMAWALTAAGGEWWRLWAFASAPALVAFGNVQWSPLLLASCYLWWLSPIVVCKPSLGFAAFVYSPRLYAVAVGSIVALTSLAVLPTWPVDWVRNLRSSEHLSPMLYGIPGLLALSFLASWQRSGRFYFVWSLIPQMAFFYDGLLLWLIPETKRQMWLLCGLSWIAFLYLGEGHPTYAARRNEYWLIYLPALAIVLWQFWGKRHANTNG